MDKRAVARPRYREIVAVPPPDRYARGWYCLGLAEGFKDGKPHSIKAFGSKLVVFQASDGDLAVLNGYCLHLGADLGEGRIVDGAIACAFHDWRWGPDGRCKAIPYSRNLPVDRTRVWTSREVNGHLIIWYDPEDNPVPDDVDVPVLQGYGTDEWSDWAWCDAVVETHPRELMDNLADPAHFFYVHGQRQGVAAAYFKNVFEGHVAAQYMEVGPFIRPPSYKRDIPYSGDPNEIDGSMRSESTWHGPAYSVDQLYTRAGDKVIHSVVFLAVLPIDTHKFRLSFGALTRRDPDMSDEENAELHALNAEAVRIATFQDVHIWQTKTQVDNPMLSRTDGPVYRMRQWYEQFYVDVADVNPQSVERFEKEVDVAYANEVWNAEMASAEVG